MPAYKVDWTDYNQHKAKGGSFANYEKKEYMRNQRFDTERLNKLSIKEVTEKLGLQLQMNKCHCFIHEEKTPSFSIFPKKNIWKCFGCGESGGVIKLVEKYNNYDFIEACKWLSNTFEISSYNNIKQPSLKRKTARIKTVSENKPDMEIYKWFFENLSVTENVRNFMKNRQYPDSLIEKYHLKGVDNCSVYFEKSKTKWGIERLVKCGLAKEFVYEDTGEITYKFTWWTNSLFFPFYDNDNNIVYIQGRTLNPKFENNFKYVNLNGVETTIFNLPILKTLNKNDTLVITEGVTDCISCCLMGRNAVGIIGAHGFKNEYVELLKDFDIYVIPDNDKNKIGEKFADKIRQAFYSAGKTIKVIPLEKPYKDISEYYIKAWNHGETN